MYASSTMAWKPLMDSLLIKDKNPQKAGLFLNSKRKAAPKYATKVGKRRRGKVLTFRGDERRRGRGRFHSDVL